MTDDLKLSIILDCEFNYLNAQNFNNYVSVICFMVLISNHFSGKWREEFKEFGVIFYAPVCRDLSRYKCVLVLHQMLVKIWCL